MAVRGTLPSWMHGHDCDDTDRLDPLPADPTLQSDEQLWGETLLTFPREWPGVHLMDELAHRLEAGHRIPRWVRRVVHQLEREGHSVRSYREERLWLAERQSGAQIHDPDFVRSDTST